MNSEELDPNNVQHDENEGKEVYNLLRTVLQSYIKLLTLIPANPLVIENGDFTWDSEQSEKPVLKNINLQIKQRQLVAIVGSVGSGKSSLISAFLGEMDKINGRVNTKVNFQLLFFLFINKSNY